MSKEEYGRKLEQAKATIVDELSAAEGPVSVPGLRRDSMFLNLAFSCFVSLLAYSAIDFVYVPWHFNMPRHMLLMGFTGTPGLVVNGVEINQQGYSGDVVQEAKDKGTVRVLLLGGSTIFLRNVAFKVKAALAARLGRNVQVVGAGLPVHTSRASLLKHETLRRFNFDIVAVYDGINDIWADNVPVKDFEYDYSHVAPFYYRTFILDRSATARQLYNIYWRWKRERYLSIGKIVFKQNGAQFRSVEAHRRNLSRLVKYITQDGAFPVVMTFAWNIPNDYSRDKYWTGSLGYENPEGDYCCPVELWGEVSTVKRALSFHNRAVRRVARQFSIEPLDQYASLSLDVTNFQDTCHFSEKGVRLFVDNIVSFVSKRWVPLSTENGPGTSP